MTSFIHVSQGRNYDGHTGGEGYIRASSILSAAAFRNTWYNGTHNQHEDGTLIRYTGVNGEACEMFVLEGPNEIFKRIQNVTQSDKRETAASWIEMFTENIPAIEAAIKALPGRD